MNKPWYRPIIDEKVAALQLDANLVEAITWQESSARAHAFRFEPAFYSHYIQGKPEWAFISEPQRVASSYGLMQIMFTTAVQYGFKLDPEYLFVPSINIEFGCKHLAHLMKWANGDTWKAVAAYNGGKGNWNGMAPQDYAHSVQAWLGKVQQRG